MSEQSDSGGTITLQGGGPECPKCSGPTYKVAEGGEQPWWCPDDGGCNLRVANDGTARGYGGE